LLKKYQIIRGSAYTLAVNIKLNKPEEIPEPTEEEVLSEKAAPVDDKKKKK